MIFRDPIAWEDTLPIRPSSPAWRAAIKAEYGSPLTEAEHVLFLELSGGVQPPPGGATDVLVVAGRRGGKSESQVARCATFEAVHVPHAVAAAPGQVLLIPIICPFREQAGEVLRYIQGLSDLPALRRMVVRRTADGVEFSTRVRIAVMTADAISLSGYTVVSAFPDEFAKLPDDFSAAPAAEMERSLRPALAPVRGAPPRRLIRSTSAYLEDSFGHKLEKEHFGKTGAPTLVLRGTTEQFNPNIDRDWLARERLRDAMAFRREYLCEWQSGIVEAWFGAESVDVAVDKGRVEPMRWQSGAYYAIAIDAAFSSDRFAIAVAISVRGDVDNDFREIGPRKNHVCHSDAWAPPAGGHLSPEECVRRVVAVCALYNTSHVYGDQFCALPLQEAFARHGIEMIQQPWTAANKAPRYRAVRESMADGNVRLPDDAELIGEFKAIRGKLLPGGGERIEAAQGHDDRVSAAVLALSVAMESAPSVLEMTVWERRARSRAAQDFAAMMGCCGTVGLDPKLFG